jgi:hydrogenase/urease accessory protein HupE
LRALRNAAPLLAWMLAATPAQAHLMNSGFGPFYDGLAHPLISPEDLLPAVAMTLLASCWRRYRLRGSPAWRPDGRSACRQRRHGSMPR